MRHPTPRSIRVAIGLIAGAALALAACGSDDGGGNTEAFCEEIASFDEVSDDATDEEALAAFEAITDVVPAEIADDWDDIVAGLTKLQEFDPETSDDEVFAEFMEISAEMEEQLTNFEEFATANCPDLPPDFFGG